MALAMLVDEHKVAWNDPVSKWLPQLEFPDVLANRELTVKDLLTHNTGLGNADLLWTRGDLSRDEILRRVRFLTPAYSIRDGFVYQNVMYAAAGEVVARASGMSWEDFIRTRIFQPLGMTRSYHDARPHARGARHERLVAALQDPRHDPRHRRRARRSDRVRRRDLVHRRRHGAMDALPPRQRPRERHAPRERAQLPRAVQAAGRRSAERLLSHVADHQAALGDVRVRLLRGGLSRQVRRVPHGEPRRTHGDHRPDSRRADGRVRPRQPRPRRVPPRADVQGVRSFRGDGGDARARLERGVPQAVRRRRAARRGRARGAGRQARARARTRRSRSRNTPARTRIRRGAIS